MNGHAFLTSKSRKLNFTTAKYHQTRSMKSIINTLNEIRQLYSSRGFRVDNIHGDNEFDKEEIKRSQLPILFHIYGRDEHVGFIERSNRTIKNKARTMVHAAPYKFVPKLMVRALIAEAVKWINAFPSMSGISRTMSPATIVQGIPKPNMKYKRIVFGSHAMVYTGTNNKLEARSVPAVALNSSNEHGGHYFMSLYSGRRIHSYEWKELPIDEDVVERVEELAINEDATEMKSGYPIFTWKHRITDPGSNVTDDIDEIMNVEELQIQDVPDNNENETDESNMHQHLVVDDVLSVDDGEEDYDLDNDEDTNYVTDELSADESGNSDELSANENENDDGNNNIFEDKDDENNEDIDEVIVDETIDDEKNEFTEVELNASGRPKRKCVGKGVDRFSFMNVAANYLFAQATDHTQISARAGIKKFGAKAISAMLNEYKQLNTDESDCVRSFSLSMKSSISGASTKPK